MIVQVNMQPATVFFEPTALAIAEPASSQVISPNIEVDLVSDRRFRFLPLLDLHGELIQTEVPGDGKHQLGVEVRSGHQYSVPE